MNGIPTEMVLHTLDSVQQIVQEYSARFCSGCGLFTGPLFGPSLHPLWPRTESVASVRGLALQLCCGFWPLWRSPIAAGPGRHP